MMEAPAPDALPAEASLLPPEGRPIVTPGELAATARRLPGVTHATGAEGPASALVAEELVAQGAPLVVVVTADLESARRAADDLEFFAAGLHRGEVAPAEVLLFVPSETQPYAEVHADRAAAQLRIAALHRLALPAPPRLLVVPAGGLVRRVLPREALQAATSRLVAEDVVELEGLVARLAAAGYVRAPVVEDPGTFAVRGGLLDVWPPQSDVPLRAELYGDLVLSIRRFDPGTQRSLEPVPSVELPPAREAYLDAAAAARARESVRALADAVDWPSSRARKLADDVAGGQAYYGAEWWLPTTVDLVPLTDHFPEGTVVVLEEPGRVVRALREELEAAAGAFAARRGEPAFPPEALFVPERELERGLAGRAVVALHRLGVGGEADTGLGALEVVAVDAPTLGLRDQLELERAVEGSRAARGREGALDPLVERLALWREHGLRVVLSARTATQAERLAQLLSHRGEDVHLALEGAPPPRGRDPIRVVVGPLSRGVVALSARLALATEEEIFGHRAHRPVARRRAGRPVLEDLRALTQGDHVVHVDHGIGRYLGLEKRTVGAAVFDLLVVEYAGGDRLYLPVHRLNQIQKHSGGEGAPRLDRLGGQSFAKTKAKVARKVREMADELLRLYASRSALERDPLPPPDDDYAALEAAFPFEETRDQATAIADVAADLEGRKVMDRLVCGDVGFGKTEVALRAAFRVALAGRQVAVLCPTTVLAQQHFLTFARRLAPFPIEIRSLSRFESKAEQEDTVKGLRKGTVDIVVGTHRALSKDVHFKNLGLVVIDEEQRFGVTHKERLKQLRSTVDVLTLTATPIPRTLQLAAGGLRDMSVIQTPPVDRRAIRTITAQPDGALIRDAIRRELSRGGQVFYVHNRVEGLYERAARLRELVPEARVAVGHGQLDEATLERTMLEFVEGRCDVLVSTAIVESGLDIPRANTILIDRADLFGLAQLYQLRGRVGRSSERAYCYLLVPPPSQLSDEARYRIEALERYTELGSGFQVASLDMELRGAGNLLGGDQSGFVSSVGFDLFCRMLEEATAELRGDVLVAEVEPELSFDVDAFVPDGYVGEVGVRLALYKRLSSAVDEAEVDELAVEMEDRFGPAPAPARHLVQLMRLKVELRRLRALGCEATARHATLHLRDDTPLDPARVAALVAARRSAFRVAPDGRLGRRALDGESFASGLDLARTMLAELAGALDPAR